MRLRWDELSPEERREFAKVSIDLMNEIANSCEEWALKSQTAALIAEVCFCFLVEFSKPLDHVLCVLKVYLSCSHLVSILVQIVRREGLSLWQELVPSLVSLSSSGPTHVKKTHFLFFSLYFF